MAVFAANGATGAAQLAVFAAKARLTPRKQSRLSRQEARLTPRKRPSIAARGAAGAAQAAVYRGKARGWRRASGCVRGGG
jgi:hypothetical protein